MPHDRTIRQKIFYIALLVIGPIAGLLTLRVFGFMAGRAASSTSISFDLLAAIIGAGLLTFLYVLVFLIWSLTIRSKATLRGHLGVWAFFAGLYFILISYPMIRTELRYGGYGAGSSQTRSFREGLVLLYKGSDTYEAVTLLWPIPALLTLLIFRFFASKPDADAD